MSLNPFLLTDGYKIAHHKMYPQGTTLVYSNFTPRTNKYAGEGMGSSVVSFGQQMVVREIKRIFDRDFFVHGKEAREILLENDQLGNGKKYLDGIKHMKCQEVAREYGMYLGTDYDVSHIEALWDLGYLPVEFKALPEGTVVPTGVPVLTVYNTLPEFYWLTNFLETLISNLLWKPITSATIAYNYKKILKSFALQTDEENIGFVDFQGHDFSLRGMDSPFAGLSSGLGHALSFLGSDSLPVISGAREYYDEEGFVVGSVNATEHSVMCAGTKEDELGTYRYLMQQFPTGILSIVSDTWNLWDVLTKHLPALKEEILARDGKIVIRPDSGDPVDIICGTQNLANQGSCEEGDDEDYRMEVYEERGVIQLLWDLFGGTINKQGYKVLDPHIGAIYGDSITPQRAKQICERLKAKGFASTNVVLGVGSFTYQYNTRDTWGFAMKATYCEVALPTVDKEGNVDGSFIQARPIFKDPVTGDGTKKSAKGLLKVDRKRFAHDFGQYFLVDDVTWEEEKEGYLQTIFKDGELLNPTTLTEIRERLKTQYRYE